MRAGELDRKITIQQNAPTADDYGQEIAAWSTLATVWAKKTDVRGREYFAQSGERAEIAAVFKIRYRADIKAEMRISYAGKFYDIREIREVGGRNEGLELMAAAAVE